MATKKRKNAIVRYFTPFGLKQICDITMLIAAIVLLIGVCIMSVTEVVVAIGLGLFIAGSIIALFRSIRVLFSGINKKSPEFKQALINAIIMGALLILAVFGLIYYFVK